MWGWGLGAGMVVSTIHVDTCVFVYPSGALGTDIVARTPPSGAREGEGEGEIPNPSKPKTQNPNPRLWV